VPDPLTAIGWGDRWSALLAEHGPTAEPGRVLRHDGVAVTVATAEGERVIPLRRGVEPVTVGDWLALEGGHLLGLLDRSSLLRRRAAGGDGGAQLLAANVDLVLLVCGLDRPVRTGRVQRGEALAWDAGATPILVLTKADLAPSVDAVLADIERDHPGLETHVTSVTTGLGLAEVGERLTGPTSVLLGESGAGKSSLVNATLGAEAAATGTVREGDAKGRHTTTNRQLHMLPAGGVVIDSPGIREVGLAGDEEAVDATFTDIEDLAATCRFNDCAHDGEPGCAVAAAVEDGTLAPARLDAYLVLRREALAAARRADEQQRRAHERRGAKALRSRLKEKQKPGDDRPG